MGPVRERGTGRRGHAPLDPHAELVERKDRHVGGSYVGFTQWVSAPSAGDSLQAMFPMVPLVEPHGDVAYVGGSLQLALTMGWGTLVSGQAAAGRWTSTIGPKRSAPCRFARGIRLWAAKCSTCAIGSPTRSSTTIGSGARIRGHLGEITAPIYAVGGWYDIFAKGVLDHVNTVRKTSHSQDARRHQHVMMGPWMHGIGKDGKVGDLDFGKGSAVDFNALQTKWFDHWSKDQPNGVETWPPFRIFVMGRNQWCDEQGVAALPNASTRRTTFTAPDRQIRFTATAG